MELKEDDRTKLQAILEDLERSRLPIDLPKIERALIAVLRALLREEEDGGSLG